MANLTGMFQQLNNAVLGNPLMGDAGGNLLTMGSQGAGQALGAGMSGLTGKETDPMSFMTPQAKARQGTQELAGLDLSTADGLSNAAAIYQKMGQPEKAVTLVDAATKKKEKELARQQQLLHTENLAKRAEAAGLTMDAEALRGGAYNEKDIEDLSKTIRDQEVTQLAAEKDGPARKGLAKSLGISEEEYDEAGLATASSTAFTDYVNNRQSTPKGYTDANGNPVMLATAAKTGKVRDPQSGEWVYPSQLDLKPSITISKVHNVSNKMIEELAMKGVENFDELYTAANDAQATLDNINRNLPLIDEMPTGTFADMRVWIGTALDTLGIPQPETTNAQVYAAEAGQRVAKEITAFGAGTGLSDKDREFAENMAAGKISVTGEALKRILNIRKQVAQGTVDNFKNVQQKVRADNPTPEMDMAMSMYTLRPPQVQGGPELSDAAKAYFTTSTGE